MNRFLIIIVLLISSGFGRSQITVENVPNNKVTKNENLVNQTDRLQDFQKDSINALLSRIENNLGYPIAVVLLNSIGGQDPHQFGLDLFNHWGIGDAKTNNGLLILIVMDVRRTEFITGTGVESILPDALCFKIQTQRMNPRFKEGLFYEGLRDGILTVQDIYQGNPVEYLNETATTQVPEDKPLTKEELREFSAYSALSIFWLYELPWYYLLVNSIALLFCLSLIFMSLLSSNLMLKYNLIKVSSIGIFKIFFPFPFLILRGYIGKLMDNIRYSTRYSPTTGNELHLMSEGAEDTFLSKLQQAKEKVGSYDYDVWVSEDHTEFVIIPYKTWFKSVRKCPSCKQRTLEYKGSTTTRSATYSSSGAGYKTYICQNCKHKKIKHYTIPKKSPPSSGSSSYSSSSSSSWSSSSSSSGGSWGGGSSSGGGAGSSW